MLLRQDKKPSWQTKLRCEQSAAAPTPTGYVNRRADLMHSSTCCMSESVNRPMTRNTSRWSTVSRCSPLTVELWSNPVVRPSGVVTSMKSCEGSSATRLFVVVMMATMVECRRLFRESSCTTTRGPDLRACARHEGNWKQHDVAASNLDRVAHRSGRRRPSPDRSSRPRRPFSRSKDIIREVQIPLP